MGKLLKLSTSLAALAILAGCTTTQWVKAGKRLVILIGFASLLVGCENTQSLTQQRVQAQELLIHNRPSNLPRCIGAYSERWTYCQGVYVYARGDAYTGEFFQGFFRGNGTLIYTNGDKYVGQFRDSLRNGLGVQTYADGRAPSEGLWVNDKFNRPEKVNLTDQSDLAIQLEKQRQLERKKQEEFEESQRTPIQQTAPSQALPNNAIVAPISSFQSERLSIEVSKKKCTELGFKPATEGHGKCVLQLSK